MTAQLDLFAPAPRIRRSRTSTAAANSIQHELPRLQKIVLDAIRAAKDAGMTDEEIVAATSLSPSTARPRRIELVEAGLVRDSGRTRLTKSRRQAAVWILTKRGKDAHG